MTGPDLDKTDLGVFVDVVTAVQNHIHATALAKGWWEGGRNDGEAIALMHSELSEALEALREGNPPSTKIVGFNQVEEELSDVIVRILDYAGGRGHNVAGALVAKMIYNDTRSYMHGGKKF